MRRVIDLSSADRQTEQGEKEREGGRVEDSGPHATCNINICHDIYVLCLSTPDDDHDDDGDDGDGALWPPLRALGVASNVLKASSHLGVPAEKGRGRSKGGQQALLSCR